MTRLLLAALLASLSLMGCGHEDAHETPHFSYEGDTGPEHWGDLSPDWALAKNGKQQSPIDLGDAGEESDDPLVLAYQESALAMVNNGHTVQVNHDAGSTLTVGGEEYTLQQFHFHAPSEHTLEQKHFLMEIHFVHANDQGDLCVLGVFVREGVENPTLAKLWEHMPTTAGPAIQVDGMTVHANDLLPADTRTFRYPGSLTTPPCTEGVRWILMQTPIEATADQAAAFTAVVGRNNRPTQPLHGREVLIGTAGPKSP